MTIKPPQTDVATMAKKLCAAANACLELMEPGANPDQELLEKAAKCFLTSIELQANCLEAYLGLAYISALTGLFTRCEDILNQASQLNPKDRRIEVLRKQIQTIMKTARHVDATDFNTLHQMLSDINFAQIPSQFLIQTDRQLANRLSFLTSDERKGSCLK